MENNDNRFITKGIREMNNKNNLTYLTLWGLYDDIKVNERESLQVFDLSIEFDMKKGLIQQIIHSKEGLEYRKTYRYYTDNPVEAKIYVIKDMENITMLLANEC